MKETIVFMVTVCMAMSVPTVAFPQKAPSFGDLQLSADALGAAVLGETIELMMHDGTYVQGKVRQASQDKIFLHIKKSEPKGRVKGPEAAIQTSDIAVVHMRKGGTIAAPVALGVIGGFLGAIGGAYAAVAADSEEGGAFFLVGLGSAAGATGGALLGREAVRKTITISVVSR